VRFHRTRSENCQNRDCLVGRKSECEPDEFESWGGLIGKSLLT
jgi:hypothetical protein